MRRRYESNQAGRSGCQYDEKCGRLSTQQVPSSRCMYWTYGPVGRNDSKPRALKDGWTGGPGMVFSVWGLIVLYEYAVLGGRVE